jgi:hypothetical protein
VVSRWAMRIRSHRGKGSHRRTPSISPARGPVPEMDRAFLFSGLLFQPAYGLAAAMPPPEAHRQTTAPLQHRFWRVLFKKSTRHAPGSAGPAYRTCGNSSAGRARRRQRRGHGFDPRFPLHFGCAPALRPAQPWEGPDGMCVIATCSERPRAGPGVLALGHSRSGNHRPSACRLWPHHQPMGPHKYNVQH